MQGMIGVGGCRYQQVNTSNLGKAGGGVSGIFKPEGNCKTLDITPSIAFLGEGQCFYSWECSPSLLVVSARQNRYAFTISVSSCFCLPALPPQPGACFHEEEVGHSWMGPAVSAPCLLLASPCSSTLPCSWSDLAPPCLAPDLISDDSQQDGNNP